jgi:flagellar M-ring protein FliF
VGYDKDRGDQVTVVNVRFPTAEDPDGVTASNPLMGFDKNDIMRAAELVVMAIVAILMMLFIVRPLLRGAMGGGSPSRLATGPDGQQMQITTDPVTGQQMALPAPGNEQLEQKIDIARIEGQVKASSVKRVAEFVDNHPEESVSIIRSWLHESA